MLLRNECVPARPVILIGLMICLVAALVGSSGYFAPRMVPMASSMSSTERGSLLWPGSFDIADGQSRSSIRFVAAGRRYTADISSSGFSVGNASGSGERALVRFAGATSGLQAHVQEQVAPPLHIFGGPRNLERLARYAAVRFAGAYQGIDVLYRTESGQLEFDFIVAPGANPELIQLDAAEGSRFSAPDEDGNVVISNGAARYTIHRPVAYQWIEGRRRTIPASFLATAGSLRFRIGQYDPVHELVIDPLVATMSTFVGSDTDFQSEYDQVQSIAIDTAGNSYVAGVTSFNFQILGDAGLPPPPGSFRLLHPAGDGVSCGGPCGYVLKFDSRNQLVYSALLAGLEISDIAVDSQGAIYLVGDFNSFTQQIVPWTGSLFNVQEPPSQNWGGSFVAKIAASGSALDYAYKFPAYNPNSANPSAAAIAVDNAGGAYVVGATNSNRLQMTPGTLRPDHPAAPAFDIDAYLFKIRPDGTGVEFGTYLGGSGNDDATDVIINPQGRAVVVGRTASTDFFGMAAVPAGAADAFVVEMSEDGASIVRGRFLGGSGADLASSIALSGLGGYLVGGNTQSQDFPVTSGAMQPYLLGDGDGFLVRLDQNFQTVYSTYYGGSYVDWIADVASDEAGNAYVAAVSFSSDMPTTSDGFQAMTTAVTTDVLGSAGPQFYKFGQEFFGTPREGHVGVLSPDGQVLSYGSYLSGYYSQPRFHEVLSASHAVVRHVDGRLLVGGSTSSSTFPVSDGVMRAQYGGWSEGFLVEFAPSTLHVTTDALLPRVEVRGRPYALQLQAIGGQPPYTWEVAGFRLPEGLTLSPSGLISGTVSELVETGAYQWTVKVTDAASRVAYKSLFLPPLHEDWPICEAGICRYRINVHTRQGLPGYPLPIPVRSVAPYSLVVSGTLPTGITFDSATGNFVGTASATGRFVYTFTTTDARGKSVALTWDVTVYDPSPPATEPSSPGGKSGGGTWGIPGLAGLLGMLWMVLRRRLPALGQPT